jgi:ubiquinone/menaquinone biosynthesis C-methylase UbiE
MNCAGSNRYRDAPSERDSQPASGDAVFVDLLKNCFRRTPAASALSGEGVRRLHLGCGTDIREGWINLDAQKLPGVDVVANLDDCRRRPLPFPADSFDEFLCSHVLEHLRDALGFMQEMHRIAKPGAMLTIRVPYGSSDDADEDPTHVRRLFVYSFSYFSQRGYWYADYGYSGDWDVENIVLTVDAVRHAGKSFDQIFEEIRSQRNVVLEMIATLKAVKPARPRGVRGKSQDMRIEIKHVSTK